MLPLLDNLEESNLTLVMVQGRWSKDSGLEAIAVYKFADIFPTNISAIDLSYDTTDTIEEFTVEFHSYNIGILSLRMVHLATTPDT